MKINIAKSSGFCFGVKRALKIAREAAGKKNKVYMLGDIVHNERVVKEITVLGIKKIKGLGKGKGKILLIRAHGAPAKVFETARKAGYKVIDATCPKVTEIHKIAGELENKGYTIIIVGDKNHDEVQGIIGQLNSKTIIIEKLKDVSAKNLKKVKKAAIVVQSTQNLDKTLAIVKALKKHIKNLKFFNTICQPTRNKQKEVKNLPSKNDLMIIIGSRSSANTKRLYEISRSLNKKSYWIQSQKDIKACWFKGILSLGIIAGASTPEATTNEIVSRIKKITSDKTSL